MTESKFDFYLEMIKKTHQSFREFLEHLPDEILDWKVHEFVPAVRDILIHIIEDQMWIVNYMINKQETKYKSPKQISKFLRDDFLIYYDKFVVDIMVKFNKILKMDLTLERDYKDFSMKIEDWIYEYIFHLHKHCGEINVAHIAWKREQRSLSS